MFGLDPFNPSVAITEILLLLAFAALVGWLLGRLVLNGRIRALREAIADKETQLAEYRQSGSTVVSDQSPAVPVDSTYVVPHAEPVIELPVAYASADSLLPAHRHDDLPVRSDEPVNLSGPMVADAIASNPPVVESPDNSEAAVLNRIAARANEINFDRIGRANPAEADDLKDIIGVGPFLERKLHSLGIYTFRQVANFTREDADTINTIIEFFPGRIERDNWVDQSKAFHERKYGQRNANQSQ